MPIPQFEPVRVPDEVELAAKEPTPSPRIKQEPRVTYGQRLSAQGLQQQQQQHHSQRQQHSGEGLVPVSQRPPPSHEAQPPERIHAPSRLMSPSPSTNSSRSSNPGNHPLQVKTERRTPSGEKTAPTIAFELLIKLTLLPPLDSPSLNVKPDKSSSSTGSGGAGNDLARSSTFDFGLGLPNAAALSGEEQGLFTVVSQSET